MAQSLAAAVRRALEVAPCSQRALAIEAEIDPSLLARIATGEKGLSVETAAKLERALLAWSDRAKDAAEMIRGAHTQHRRK
jgi:ribosome-binding protein aMBF1 (putative translation factor)